MTPASDLALPVAPAAESAIEKTALECYVAPAKPSLVGLSRAALAEALRGVGFADVAAPERGDSTPV